MSTQMFENQLMTQTLPAKRYHHGNLRAALIEAGLALIRESGVDSLTLREIGARLGVSRTAAYRHFASKDDLLGAIREASFGLFADSLEESRRHAPPAFAARLSALALAYVRFAEAYPAHYEVMFGMRGGVGALPGPPTPEGARAFRVLYATIQAGQESGEARAGDTLMLARMVWAQVHGITTLRLETDLRPERSRDAVCGILFGSGAKRFAQ